MELYVVTQQLSRNPWRSLPAESVDKWLFVVIRPAAEDNLVAIKCCNAEYDSAKVIDFVFRLCQYPYPDKYAAAT